MQGTALVLMEAIYVLKRQICATVLALKKMRENNQCRLQPYSNIIEVKLTVEGWRCLYILEPVQNTFEFCDCDSENHWFFTMIAITGPKILVQLEFIIS